MLKIWSLKEKKKFITTSTKSLILEWPGVNFINSLEPLRPNFMTYAQLLKSFFTGTKVQRKARKFGSRRKTVYEINPCIEGQFHEMFYASVTLQAQQSLVTHMYNNMFVKG